MHKYVLICNQDIEICLMNDTILYASQEYVNMHTYAMSSEICKSITLEIQIEKLKE